MTPSVHLQASSSLAGGRSQWPKRDVLGTRNRFLLPDQAVGALRRSER